MRAIIFKYSIPFGIIQKDWRLGKIIMFTCTFISIDVMIHKEFKITIMQENHEVIHLSTEIYWIISPMASSLQIEQKRSADNGLVKTSAN